MKRQLLTILGIMVATLAAFATNGEHKLTIVVKNVKNSNGIISATLFNAETNWLKKGEVKEITIDNKEVVVIEFEKVPDGIYAVSVIHDENSNGDLDANFVGMPTEPYGFSNDARGMFGPASFNESKFSLSGNKTIEIKVE